VKHGKDKANADIAPLHVRSGYSLLRGPAGLERLVGRAGALGHGRVALTDVNSLCGATRFCRLAGRVGIEPIVGAELLEGGRSVVALIADEAGYENLCRIITRIQKRLSVPGLRRRAGGSAPAFLRDLSELSGGLEFVVEDGALAGRLLAAGLPRRQLWLGIDPPTQCYSQLRGLVELAGRFGVPLVATGKALMAEPGDIEVARLLAAIRTGSTFQTVAAAELPHPKALLRAGEQLRSELADFPEAIANNLRLAERCGAFRLLPRPVVFPEFPAPPGLSPAAYLRRLCEEGMVRRYGRQTPEARARLDKELALIERMGFSEYFLVVWDIVLHARRRGAPVAGRGSGASSLAAYLLGITNVCPLAYDIPFERFLHERREDFPDLDVDFCWRMRDDVIDYVFDRWGADRVAMVSSHNTFQPRSALRGAARALGLSNEQISKMDGNGPANGGDGPARAFRGLSPETSGRLATLSKRILNLPRLLSVHPGGVVIGRKPIDRYVPVQQAAKGVTITQYDKDGVEDIGLVKLDLLGNRNLSTVREACELIRRRRGERIDVEALPTADPRTIELLRDARTVGCNQLESPAMRRLLRMMLPDDTRDVMKVLALIRPGAAAIGMKETFIRRRRGLEAAPPAPPGVEAVLGGTHGVMLYEDDVMLAAAAMLGCDLGEADRFRRAIRNCRTDRRRLELSREFLRRCAENGIDGDYAKDMWVQMAKFNAYSFCRAHAAGYALLAYGGAYLKAHWPLEFWTAALNNNQSMYHLRVYVAEARRDGVAFLLPDVNRSRREFTADGGAIRVGLNLVSGLGPAGAAVILGERARRGAFEGLSDFLARTRLGEAEARSLILCGAFDGFARPRPTLMMELRLFCRLAAARHVDQPVLLRAAPVIPAPPGDYSPTRKYFDERRVLGISVREHIMSLVRPLLGGKVDADSRDIPAAKGKRVRIAGFLEAQRTTRTRRGGVTFLTLDDEYGLFEVTLPDGVRPRQNRPFSKYGPYVVTGRVENQYDSLSITAKSVEYCKGALLAAGAHSPRADRINIEMAPTRP